MNQNGIFFRFENADADAMSAEDTTEAVGLSAEADLAVDEQLGASEELSQVETGIEQAGEAQAELTDVIDTVEEAAQDGGMTEREAVHLEARIANIARLLGTTPSAMGLTFRRESFGKNQNRLTATKYKLEGLKEWGAKIWELLVKAWTWLRDAVVNFVGGMSKNAETIEKSLKDQATRFKDLKTSGGFKKDKLTAGAKMFSIEGSTSVDSVKKLLDNVAKFKTMTDLGFNVGAGQIDKMPADETGIKVLNDNFVKSIVVSGAANASKTAEGKKYGMRLGSGQALALTSKKEKLADGEVEIMQLGIETVDDKIAEDYAAFTADQLKQVNAAALTAVVQLKEFQKIEAEAKASMDNSIEFCKKQIAIAGKFANGDDADSKAKRTAVDFARIANQASINFSKVLVNKVPTAGVSLVKGAKDLVDTGLANFKAEEKKEEKK